MAWAYMVMIGGFIVFVLVQSVMAIYHQDSLNKLYQIGVMQTLCKKHENQLIFLLLQTIILYGLMAICGLSLLYDLSALDGVTGCGWMIFLLWLCVRYFCSGAVLKLVKNGTLYL